MRDAPYPDVPPDFGNWLAGLIDGEGSFAISNDKTPRYRKPTPKLRCRFAVSLRDDDRATIEMIAATTGFGQVYGIRRTDNRDRTMVRWEVQNQRDCLALVRLVDAYPLRSKKARDYALWREAVIEWSGATGTRWNPRDWSRLVVLKQRLEAVRAYHPSALPEVGRLDAVPRDDQLVLEEGIATRDVPAVPVAED